MTALAPNPEVARSLGDSSRWREEPAALREPCYAHGGKNICIIQPMKDVLALLFFKVALLSDPDGLLERQGPNSRSGFRMRFTSVGDVAGAAESIRA